MLYSVEERSLARHSFSAWKIGFLALLSLTILPGLAWAENSCNPDLDFTITSPAPFFVGDALRVSSDMGAGAIAGGSYMDIYDFGFMRNCKKGEGFEHCSGGDATVEFLGNFATTCKNPAGDDILLFVPEDNLVPITSKNGPIRTAANTQCNVQFDVSVTALPPDQKSTLIRQSIGWPIPGGRATMCDNGLTSSASANILYPVNTCGIDLKKQVSVDGQTWFDADSVGTAPSLLLGGTAYYRLIVTNTGSADFVQPITVVDNDLGINTTTPALQAGDTVTLTGSEITQLTANGHCKVIGNLQNTASVTGVCRTGDNPVSDSLQNSAYLVCTGTPSIDIEKATNGQDADTGTGPLILAGEPVNWTYKVTNDGEVPLTGIVVTDDQGVPVNDCPTDELAVGEQMTCTASGTAVAGQYANIGKATGNPPVGDPVSDTDPSHYFGVTLAINIVKTASPTTYSTAGTSITYTFVVRNDSNVNLTKSAVTDPLRGVGTISCDWANSSDAATPAGTLSPGETLTCTAPYTTTQADVDAGSVRNIATVRGTPPVGVDVTDDDPATITSTAKPSIGIDKTASPTTYAAEDTDITYTFVVTNTGGVTLTSVGVTDPLPGLGTITCDWAGSSDGSTPAGTLSPGETVTCTAPYTTTQADVDAGKVDNTATAKGTPPSGPPVTDTDPAQITSTAKPSIGIDKTASPTTYAAEDTDITYTFVVTNTGGVTLTSVGVTDPLPGLGTITCDWAGSSDGSTPAGTLSPGETVTCTAPYTTTQADVNAGKVDNTATAKGTPPVGDDVTDDDPATITSTATPSIDLIKEISIDGGQNWFDANDVGSAVIAVFPSGAEYRLTVKNDGNVGLKNVKVNDSTLGISDYVIGSLAVGQQVVLTSGDISELSVATRCDGRGTFTNNATASGESVADDTPVNDPDAAVLKCIGEPAIKIEKDISPTGPNGPWYPDETPAQEYPSDAWYRIKLTNVGTAPLENLDVLDGDLLVSEPVGSLDVGQSVTLDSGQVSELYVQDRCTGAGKVGNTASVSGNSVDDPNDTVNEGDSATLVCVGSPSIAVKKEISTDNSSWDDANDVGSALTVQAPSAAYYRITVTNTGPVDLTNVVLNDGTLGITDYAVGDIAAGNSVVLTNGDIGALFYPGRCENAGSYGNTANVQGESKETGSKTSLATDEAWLVCTGTPDIQIVKEISVDGGNHWYDGTSPQVIPPADAWYRITVSNTGTADLENVVVNDLDLGIVNFAIGDLLLGDPPVVLDSGDIGALYQQNRCTSSGLFVNTASAGGDSVEFPFGSVNDSDDATMDCLEQLNLCEDGKPKRLLVAYDGDDDTSHSQDPGKVKIQPATVIFPADPVWIEVRDHKGKLPTEGAGQWVPKDGSFWVSGPKSRLSPAYTFYIYTAKGGTLLQTINFHTSCSQPLDVGDEFGAITVLGGKQ